MKDEADALLADLELKGVLGRLECDETTKNLFRGHFVPKPGGKGVRLVTDYTPINPYIERPVHPFSSPDIVFQSVGKDSKCFWEAGRSTRLLPDPSRAGEPEVDCFPPASGVVLLQGARRNFTWPTLRG